MENVVGEQGLALQQLFSYKSSYSFKTSDCHKISPFNDGGLKLGHSVSARKFYLRAKVAPEDLF